MVRVCRGNMAPTVAHQIVRQILLMTLEAGRMLTCVADEFTQPELAGALDAFGFFETHEGYWKISPSGIMPADRIASVVTSMEDAIPIEYWGLQEWAEMLEDLDQTLGHE